MKYFLLFLTSLQLMLLPALRAQDADATAKHVKWTFTSEKIGEGAYTLKFKANIAEGWKLFSPSMGDDDPNTRVILDSISDVRAAITGLGYEGKELKAPEPLLDNQEIKFFEKETVVTLQVKFKGPVNDLKGTINYFILKGEEINPEETEFRFKADAAGNLSGEAGGLVASADQANKLKRDNIDLQNPVNKVGGIGNEGETNPWFIFLLGFLGGLLALVTPCVFPMIPLTVSFFTKSAQDKKKGIFNATMYGFFIFLIYILFSVPFHIAGLAEPEIFNNISTNVWLNVFFFAVFVVFAISFFGYFEITLPSGLASKADSKANKGTLVGIFFMALTLVVVSFSCTGPILGSLLAGSLGSDGGAWLLTAGMAGFGVSLALPFALFAMFPNWLSSLPKSGGWLTSVKVVLGFIEVALAIKFLSNADLVMHWGILHRETFFLIWIIIGLLTTLYLLGLIRFPHDSPVKKLGATRIFFAVIFGAFTIYLLPGVTNTKYANVRLMSGFAPPMSYSWYGNSAHEKGAVEPNVINDYDKALELAKAQNKPILIDFTGWACVNCRNMEENVWTDPEVHALIKDNYILVSLYVDDKQKLPEDEQFMHTFPDGRKKPIKTIGNKYATMQTLNFNNNSQPLYVLISPEEKLLTYPVAYTPNIQEYANWLRSGLDAFKKVKK
ncbi:protein-disulfide reductase DsbD family protein [Chitinophaga niabensis]|uniref:Thiol:disulfide interchange protein DsbD n=1 Tax=Chitinophaga niabensis TaxID=536979 RepID=A0A1N6J682_9BACT|nr:thioredoxin family protein [Chitinophaga niabensis]SIO39743.1 thiol:disulfide interchange protein DsbD [Chitinophaga niabensis]